MAAPNVSANFDQSAMISDRTKTDDSNQSTPFFDVIALWQNAPGRAVEQLKDSDKKIGDQSDSTNKWTASGEVKPGVDRLTLTSQYRVSASDFKKANPDVDLEKLDTAGGFNLKHPTTGATDSGWKFKAREKDGSVKLTRDYRVDVAAQKEHGGVLEAMPGVPESFTKQVQRKIDEMPPNVVANLKKNGYKIITASTIPDAMPELDKLTPRGWPADSTFINSDGTHDDVSKRIIAPMRFMHEGEMQPVMRDNVVTHQVGHAIDFANGSLSATPEFVDAYSKDMAAIGHKDSGIVKYLSQPDGVGRQETFAAVFGLVTTGPENESDTKFLTQSFPNVMKVVKKQIEQLK
ncbi:MAG: hypothetical protein SGJ27_03450 [Candidatus Melainabacteria bacterium]|nr:hypothetical protein [Candidatus Melainabacteria bacterium]